MDNNRDQEPYDLTCSMERKCAKSLSQVQLVKAYHLHGISYRVLDEDFPQNRSLLLKNFQIEKSCKRMVELNMI